MAEAVRYVCGKCGHAIEAWSDGNPYYIDDAGTKQYAYHPDHERLARCIRDWRSALKWGSPALLGMRKQSSRGPHAKCRASFFTAVSYAAWPQLRAADQPVNRYGVAHTSQLWGSSSASARPPTGVSSGGMLQCMDLLRRPLATIIAVLYSSCI